MARSLVCPECKTSIEVAAGEKPICPSCGYAGPKGGAPGLPAFQKRPRSQPAEAPSKDPANPPALPERPKPPAAVEPTGAESTELAAKISGLASEVRNMSGSEEPLSFKPAPPNRPGREVSFYEGPGVLITNTRFVSGGTTYALNGITSVSLAVERAKRGVPGILMAVGLLMLLVGLSEGPGVATVGVLFAAIALFWLLALKDKYWVRITTAAGEFNTLSGAQNAIAPIVDALNKAIIHRG